MLVPRHVEVERCQSLSLQPMLDVLMRRGVFFFFFFFFFFF